MPDEIAATNIDMPKVSAPLPFAAVAILAAVIFPFLSAPAPATTRTTAMSSAVEEKLGSSKNLARIFTAIHAYLDFISTAGGPPPLRMAITVE